MERVRVKVLPRRAHWMLDARAKRVGVVEERRRAETLPIIRPVEPRNGIRNRRFGFDGLCKDGEEMTAMKGSSSKVNALESRICLTIAKVGMRS